MAIGMLLVGVVLYGLAFVWGISGIGSTLTVLVYWMWSSVALAIVFGRLCFLLYYEWVEAGWLRARLVALALSAVVAIGIGVFFFRLAWAVDFGNHRRFAHAVSVERLGAWADELVSKYPAGASTLKLEESEVPENMLKLLRDSGVSSLTVCMPDDVGDEACVQIMLGRGELTWGIYAGRATFVPTRAIAGFCYRWGSGVYGFVRGV
jgi:hypothetical protein